MAPMAAGWRRRLWLGRPPPKIPPTRRPRAQSVVPSARRGWDRGSWGPTIADELLDPSSQSALGVLVAVSKREAQHQPHTRIESSGTITRRTTIPGEKVRQSVRDRISAPQISKKNRSLDNKLSIQTRAARPQEDATISGHSHLRQVHSPTPSCIDEAESCTARTANPS